MNGVHEVHHAPVDERRKMKGKGSNLLIHLVDCQLAFYDISLAALSQEGRGLAFLPSLLVKVTKMRDRHVYRCIQI